MGTKSIDTNSMDSNIADLIDTNPWELTNAKWMMDTDWVDTN